VTFVCVILQNITREKQSIQQKAMLEQMAEPTTPYKGISIIPAISNVVKPMNEQIAL